MIIIISNVSDFEKPFIRNISLPAVHNTCNMSQGLSGLVPCLSLEEQIYQADDLVSLSRQASTEPLCQDSQSSGSCQTFSMDSDPEEKGFMDVKVIPASFHRSNSQQVH